jgi:hypothetical protein
MNTAKKILVTRPQLEILPGGKADACPDCNGAGGSMFDVWDETGFRGEWLDCGCQIMAQHGGEPLEEVTDQGAPLDWNPEEFHPW